MLFIVALFFGSPKGFGIYFISASYSIFFFSISILIIIISYSTTAEKEVESWKQENIHIYKGMIAQLIYWTDLLLLILQCVCLCEFDENLYFSFINQCEDYEEEI